MVSIKKLIVSVSLIVLMLGFAVESKAAATYYECDLYITIWTDDNLNGDFDTGEEIPLDEAEVKFETTSPGTANGALSLVSGGPIVGTGEGITVKRRNNPCTGVVDNMSALPTATYRGRALGPNGILGGLKTQTGSVVDFDNEDWFIQFSRVTVKYDLCNPNGTAGLPHPATYTVKIQDYDNTFPNPLPRNTNSFVVHHNAEVTLRPSLGGIGNSTAVLTHGQFTPPGLYNARLQLCWNKSGNTMPDVIEPILPEEE